MNDGGDQARTPNYERVALVLQGGGALGAYQVGVYEALCAAGQEPHWVAGTSIGGVNAALIAGNPPAKRLERLSSFWSAVSRPGPWPLMSDETARKLFNSWSSAEALVMGQPGFFEPRPVNPWFARPGSPEATSFYDTSPLADTLAKLIDLDELNAGRVRVSLGAVDVESGALTYFDSAKQRIGIEHVMASAALPPGFPPIAADGRLYWDGGVVSNTPLETVLDDEPRVSTMCYMVDLFDAAGPAPTSMEDVLHRQKDITYASRSRHHVESYRRTHNLRRAVTALWSRLPAEARAEAELEQLSWLGCTTTMNVLRFVYRSRKYETGAKDYEFSRASIAEHRAAGQRDAAGALAKRPWTQPVPPHVGVVVTEVASPAPAASA